MRRGAERKARRLISQLIRAQERRLISRRGALCNRAFPAIGLFVALEFKPPPAGVRGGGGVGFGAAPSPAAGR